MTRGNIPLSSVEPDQIWKSPSSEHFRIVIVNDRNAILKRCTPGGIVLDEMYSELLSVRRLLERYEFVGRSAGQT